MILKCLFCESTKLDLNSEEMVCLHCSKKYPLVDGIPVLVKDWVHLKDKLDEARNTSPLWYEQEQPPEESSPWKHHLKKRRAYVEKIIKRYLSNREKVDSLLDLGCGDGNNLVWLKQYSEKSYGSDYNPLRLARAKIRNPDSTFFLADILDYPTKSESFDIIFFNHVIEHIPDDNLALLEIYRALKHDGLLILGTPNEGCWWWQYAYRKDPEILKKSDHVHFYTADIIEAKLIRAGFQLITRKHMGWGPPDWHLDGRIRKYKIVDDIFELLGRTLFTKQASSLYIIATKPESY